MAFSVFLYLLELENDKYYVGQTDNLEFRFKDHASGKGAKWAKMHKPMRKLLHKEIQVETPREAMLEENRMTLQYMEIFGWENVRGGQYVVAESYWLRDRIAYIYDFEQNKIKYYLKNCKYLFGSTDDWIVFVLELENGLFYVGSTDDLGKCLSAHFNGKGIALTRDNRVIRVLEWIVVPPNGGSYLELKKHIISNYIHQYGWDNVWGGQRLPKT